MFCYVVASPFPGVSVQKVQKHGIVIGERVLSFLFGQDLLSPFFSNVVHKLF